MNPESPATFHATPELVPICAHRTKTGRRCHNPVLENSVLCFRHAPKYAVQAEVDLTAAFGDRLLDNPQSAANINGFVGRLAVLVVQNRISARRAAVLADLSNFLLRSLVEIDRENDTARFPEQYAAAIAAAAAAQSGAANPAAPPAQTPSAHAGERVANPDPNPCICIDGPANLSPA